MRSRAVLLSTLALVGACGSDPPEPVPETPRARAATARRPTRCGADEAWAGGEVLQTPDGARLYYRAAGPADAPAIVYLHGGPGHNALSFELAVGSALEAHLRVVTLDQRGCGRSSGGAETLPLGMTPTLVDLERLRAHLGITRWSVVGHSFGGLLAVLYAQRHPAAVERLVLVEPTLDPIAALEHQISVLAEGGSAEITQIAVSDAAPLDRMVQLFQLLGRAEVQRRLHWASQTAQRRAEGWEQRALLTECSRDGVLPSYREDGWIAPHPELLQRLAQPALYIAGRQSHVLGTDVVESTAATLGARLHWLEESGHFPYVEEPEAFATVLVTFVRGTNEPRAPRERRR